MHARARAHIVQLQAAVGGAEAVGAENGNGNGNGNRNGNDDNDNDTDNDDNDSDDINSKESAKTLPSLALSGAVFYNNG